MNNNKNTCALVLPLARAISSTVPVSSRQPERTCPITKPRGPVGSLSGLYLPEIDILQRRLILPSDFYQR
ncbi:hypothetical protein T492DRAFT_324829 [Pavlovales sp. CCMP2436]|nr:hypothetical protein T492DRAFT_324829 [Pavlovales sp. CCMP2436]